MASTTAVFPASFSPRGTVTPGVNSSSSASPVSSGDLRAPKTRKFSAVSVARYTAAPPWVATYDRPWRLQRNPVCRRCRSSTLRSQHQVSTKPARESAAGHQNMPDQCNPDSPSPGPSRAFGRVATAGHGGRAHTAQPNYGVPPHTTLTCVFLRCGDTESSPHLPGSGAHGRRNTLPDPARFPEENRRRQPHRHHHRVVRQLIRSGLGPAPFSSPDPRSQHRTSTGEYRAACGCEDKLVRATGGRLPTPQKVTHSDQFRRNRPHSVDHRGTTGRSP